MNTLVDYHYRQKHKATSGGGGGRQKMHGAAGDDLILKAPAGTVARDAETGELLADLTEPGQRVMVARGGRGGLGNVHFATSTNQAPREAQLGEPGEDRWIELELKLIADVGLVGYPNAGKSTLLSVVTAARPKIADYPFTTLTPNLGVAVIGDPTVGDDYSFVIADIPGLIEGAAQGVGLGHEFLRHVERCRLLLHLIDGVSERDPWEEFEAINRELEEYSPELATRPQIIVLTKMDLQEARDRWPALRERAEEQGMQALAISSATSDGLQDLLNTTAQRLIEIRRDEAEAQARQPIAAAAHDRARAAPGARRRLHHRARAGWLPRAWQARRAHGRDDQSRKLGRHGSAGESASQAGRAEGAGGRGRAAWRHGALRQVRAGVGRRDVLRGLTSCPAPLLCGGEGGPTASASGGGVRSLAPRETIPPGLPLR